MAKHILELTDSSIKIINSEGQEIDVIQKDDYLKHRLGFLGDDLPTIMLFTPIKNRGWVLPEFLEGIYNLDYPKDKIRVVFILNDSSDASESYVKQWKHKYEQEYLGIDVVIYNINAPDDKRNQRRLNSFYSYLAVIRNHGLHQLRNEDYVFSVDSDIILKPNTLKQLISHKKDIVASLVPNNIAETVFNILDWNSQDVAKHISNIPENKLIEVGFTGACYIINSRVINAGVRYGYHIQGEDGYFCKMALERGFKLYCDTSLKQIHKMRKEDY